MNCYSQLHLKLNTPFLKRKTLSPLAKIERQTNSFTVELLLPDSKMEEYKHTDMSLEKINVTHGIPKEIVRLKRYYFFSFGLVIFS